MTSKEQCCDDRFEIINETKQYIINATNIDTSPEEMAVLDSICFRLWQLGLTKRNKDKLKELTQNPTFNECIKEWEERGWKVIDKEQTKLYLIKPNYSCYTYPTTYYISFYTRKENQFSTNCSIDKELLDLLSKTLKALESYNEQGISN